MGSITQAFNWRHGLSGRVLQGRYKQIRYPATLPGRAISSVSFAVHPGVEWKRSTDVSERPDSSISVESSGSSMVLAMLQKRANIILVPEISSFMLAVL